MKKCTTLFLALLAVVALLLSSCDSDGKTPGDDNKYIYSFSYNSVTIVPGEAFEKVEPLLGTYTGYYEAASCAFDGNDKIYTYGSLQISVSAYNGVDTISMLTLLDDSLATPEGVRVGSTREEVIAAYGDDGLDNGNSIVYYSGTTQLVFILRDGNVTSVQYRSVEATAID